MSRLRVVFMGTAPLSCESLRALLAVPNEFEVVTVVSQPDRARGRDLKLQPSAVKILAEEAGLPLLQPERARDPGFIESLAGLQPSICAVAAYGQILPPALLELPRYGCLNVHTSLLPKYRGAAPIQWAIINGEKETGVTIMRMDAGLDTGDVLAQASTTIDSTDNSLTLHDRLARMGGELLVSTIPKYVSGSLRPQAQDHSKATHARKVTKEDGLIRWEEPATAIWNRLRGLVPWPGVYTHALVGGQPTMLKIWEARVMPGSGAPGRILSVSKQGILVACGSDGLEITAVQHEGSRRMSVRDFLAGHSLQPGDRLG